MDDIQTRAIRYLYQTNLDRAWMDGASRGNPGEAGFGVLLPTDQGSEEIVGWLDLQVPSQ